jgi:hypothetical protein
VYVGTNNLQLYSTDLTGHNVQKFGSPLPDGGGEPVLAASLGLGGFNKGDIYASGGDANIYHYANAGGAPSLFAALPAGTVSRQIFFDPVGTFGGDMIVTTNTGIIYTVNSAGHATQLANINADTEGMDIAGAKYGMYAGQLLVASENTGLIHAISNGGVVTTLNLLSPTGAPFLISEAETVSVVPTTLGSGNPLEGFYVANFAVDIQKADAGQFLPYLGDAIVTSEFGGSSPVWDLSYNGDAANTFTVTQIGTIPNQSEDGIFVTATRIKEVGTPEPATWAMLMLGVGMVGLSLRQRKLAIAA